MGGAIVLRRARAQRPMLLAVLLIVLLVTTLVTTLVLYAGATIDAGLARAVALAPAPERGVEVTAERGAGEAGAASAGEAGASDAGAGEAGAQEAAVVAALGQALRPVGAAPPRVLRSVRSAPLAVAGSEAEVVAIGYENLSAHAELVDGTFPEPEADPAPADAEEPLPVTLHAEAAAALGVSTGDLLELGAGASSLTVQIVGTWRPRDTGDVAWFGDPLETTGVEREGVFGPVAADPVALAALLPDLTARWRATPHASALTVDGVQTVGARVVGLQGTLEDDPAVAAATPDVTTALPELLAGLRGPVLGAQANIAVPVVLLVVLVLATVLLGGRLVGERRGEENALLLARGVSRPQASGWALGEAVAVAAPGALLGAPLAVLLTRLVATIGPLQPAGVELMPQLDSTVWIVSVLVAAGCALMIGLTGARGVRGSRAGGLTSSLAGGGRTGLLRAGGDVALLAVAGVAVWQARQYGSPVVRSDAGTLEVDPVVVLAPVLALLAGAALCVRLVPLLARGAELVVARGRRLVPALASWQLGRRQAVVAAPTLLLVLAVGAGTLTAAYAESWSQVQADEAAYDVGADVRVVTALPPSRTDPPPLGRAQTYAGLPGVEHVMVAERSDAQLGQESVTLLALDSAVATQVMAVRPDLVPGASLAELLAPLGGGVEGGRAEGGGAESVGPEPLAALELPAGEELVVEASATATEVELILVDDEDEGVVEADREEMPAEGLAVQVDVLLRDGSGQLSTVSLGQVDVGGGETTLRAPLPGGDVKTAVVQVRITFAGSAALRRPQLSEAALALTDLRVTGGPAGDGAPANELPAPWYAAGEGPVTVGEETFIGDDVRVSGDNRTLEVSAEAELSFDTTRAFTVLVGDQPAPTGPMPAIVTTGYLDSAGLSTGDTVTLQRAGADALDVEIVGTLGAMPTVPPQQDAVLVDFARLAALDVRDLRDPPEPSEWWLSVAGGASPADVQADVVHAVTTMPGPPVRAQSRAVLTESLQSSPLGAGPQGALVLAVAAAAALAAVGAVLGGAVSARARQSDAVALRTLGASRGQLSRAVIAEQGLLALAGVVLGVALGVVVARLLLPVLIAPPAADPAVGLPILPSVPWPVVAALAAGVAALVLAVSTLPWRRRDAGPGRGAGRTPSLAVAVRGMEAP